MKKLTMKSKPKNLTLSEMWELYLLDTGEPTPDFIISVLDLRYPKLDRDDIDISILTNKYRESLNDYSSFLGFIKGMVGNG
jgi:hypothetical protein